MRLGVLTSGGDCAGLNAALRAVVPRAVDGYGWTVVGIEQGIRGLMDRPPSAREMALDIFDGTLMRQGGTILGTTPCAIARTR
jgi:6-phosphofructokinase 1